MELRFGRAVDLPVLERMTSACRFFDPSKLTSELILRFCAHAPSCTDMLITTLDEQIED